MTQVLKTCAEAQAELESPPETAEQNCSTNNTESHAECERNEAESAQVEIHSARYTYKELGQKFSVSADAIRKDMAKIVETFESCGVEPAFLEREGRRVYVTEEGLEALSAHRSDSEYLNRVRQSLTPKEPSTPAPANNPGKLAVSKNGGLTRTSNQQALANGATDMMALYEQLDEVDVLETQEILEDERTDGTISGTQRALERHAAEQQAYHQTTVALRGATRRTRGVQAPDLSGIQQLVEQRNTGLGDRASQTTSETVLGGVLAAIEGTAIKEVAIEGKA